MIYLVSILLTAINLYTFLLFASILMSWIPNLKESKFGQMISSVTDPYLDIFRKFIPPFGMIDFSPIIAILALRFAADGIRVLAGYLI